MQHLRDLPKVHTLLESPSSLVLQKKYPRTALTRVFRQLVQQQRERLLAGSPKTVSLDWYFQQAELALEREVRGNLCPVINATGVILHTNLGRAPLCQRALRRVQEVSQGYCNVEYSLAERKRGKRMDSVRSLLCELTGAEDAHVVNNNAAAVFLALSALAAGREAIVSRGELVEIGGSFRIPDVMTSAGVHLQEVGTTNRTHLRDYQQAINEETGLLTKIHPSNYEIRGFTKEVSLEEVVALGKETGIPTLMDLGSGALVRHPRISHREPHWQDVVATGADVVTCSGDKLLGGPQAGILLGKSEFLRKIARHPMARALRVDKMTLAALEATLQVYRDGEEVALQEIPVLAQLSKPIEELEHWAFELQRGLETFPSLRVEMQKAEGRVGGGTLPGMVLPTVQLALIPEKLSPEVLETQLRTGHTPIITLLERGRVVLDLRTIHPHQWPIIEQALHTALSNP